MWRLRAWLMRDRDDSAVMAAFVASSAAELRAPATRMFPDEAAARRWVEDEARFLDAAVEWV